MKLIKIFSIVLLLSFTKTTKADEGMWLPQLLQTLNEARMKQLGMKISASDIYSISKSSLKDAIVSFGGFCTGEVISDKGLLLTNHHCGFDVIQNHSSLQNNYIRDGFWAKNFGEELPNKGLFVTFIVRIDNVTKAALAGVTASMTEMERQNQIDKNLSEARKNAKKETRQDVMTRAFFEGNQYFLFVTETFRDVRLVGAPPSSIGNFGKDTDNWVWPRHTGDFSMFRIYADKNNQPAEYSPENVPYIPKRSLKISMSGISEKDFTMVFGFPGRTTQYLPAIAVEQIRTVNDPAKIAIRDKALQVIDGFMRKDEGIKIQYAAKYASIQNAYKKWQGEVLGLTKTNANAKKLDYEKIFQQRVEANPAFANYKSLLQDLNTEYNAFKEYGHARDYYTEIMSKIELFTIASQLNALANAYESNAEKGYDARLKSVKAFIDGMIGEYNVNVDKKLFEALMPLYANEQAAVFVAPEFSSKLKSVNQNFSILANELYNQSDLYNEAALKALLAKPAAEAVASIRAFEAVQLFSALQKNYQSAVQKPSVEISNRLAKLQRSYTQAQLEVMKEKKFYPDANSTLRVTYGQVGGYIPKDGANYGYATYLDGVMEKYKPGDYEFDVPEKLRDLYSKKDYGAYGTNGKMPVCFIASNHTTGGNSGSPALDAYGNLIGLNFDRVWEGTMSDINYDPSICRNIMVDIRYVLFIADKFAGAGHLVKEMKLVYPKKKK
ncbi:MAG TPA: S46 family peptidase [Ferruginibacter sp.]|nr:S46 family peptidase [Ferruginibacter sp.]HRE64014.1 S46 family peptidase [Ferruginibacter sp.]